MSAFSGRHTGRWGASINRFIILVTTGLAAFSMGGTIVISYLVYDRNSYRELEARMYRIANRLSVSLGLPLWEFDDRLCIALLKGELAEEEILRIVVEDALGKGFAEVLRQPEAGSDFRSAPASVPTPPIVFERNILHNGVNLGKVIVEATDRVHKHKLIDHLFRGFFTLMGVFLVGTALLVLLIKTQVVRPIVEIGRTLELLTHGDLDARSRIPTSFELRDLQAQLNAMAEAFQEDKEQMRQLLHEREELLREIHHRVGNNLQVMAGLIMLSVDKEGIALLEVIQTMARVHEYIYIQDHLELVDFAQIVPIQVGTLNDQAEISAARAFVEARVDRFILDLGSAVPCALLIEEMCRMALRQGATEKSPWGLTLELLGSAGTRTIRLSARRDSGTGRPRIVGEPSTLQKTLMRQLRARFIPPEDEEGAEIGIVFSVQEPVGRGRYLR